jgi:hypothetical protein
MTQWTMRILGLLNVSFGLDGIWYFISRLTWHFHNVPAIYNIRDWAIFSLLSLCTVSMVSYLAYLGITLIIGNKVNLLLSVFIFAAELFVFFADAVNVVPFNQNVGEGSPN